MKTLLIVEKNPSGSHGLRTAKERGLNVIFIGSNKYHNRLGGDDMKYVDRRIEMDPNDMQRVIEIVQKRRNEDDARKNN